MSDFSSAFTRGGFVAIPNVLDEERLSVVRTKLDESTKPVAGDRRFLDNMWCRQVAADLREELKTRRLIANSYAAVLCTYFDKSASTNWGVAPHRDLSVPVREEFQKRGWKNWTKKQGIPHVQPPTSFLLNMFAVRVNIDDSSEESGALIVAPGSHLTDSDEPPSAVAGGSPGRAFMMSPLLFHASKKSSTGSSRRVLHFLFGPADLGPPMRWFYAA